MLAKINISHSITGEPKEKFSLMRFSGANCGKKPVYVWCKRDWGSSLMNIDVHFFILEKNYTDPYHKI